MRHRRFVQISTSDDDEEEEAPPRQQQQQQQPQSLNSEDKSQPRRKSLKRLKLAEEEEESKEKKRLKLAAEEEESKEKKREKGREASEDEEEAEEAPQQEDAKPIGEPARFSGKGRGQRSHYKAFEFNNNRYELEDPVLLVPEDKEQKPYVAIIKDITQTKDGSMMVTGQWFYRPEEAEKKGGGSWQSSDTRELFYSFHRDEVPAESVMHKCVVHFVPIDKKLPDRKQHPGFIVQKVYDNVAKKLGKLTDSDYEEIRSTKYKSHASHSMK